MPSLEFQSLDLGSGSPLVLPAMRLLRDEVLSDMLTPEEYRDNYLRVGAHFYTLTQGSELLGVGSLLFRYSASADIGVLAIQSQYQWSKNGSKYGYGSRMVASLEQEALRIEPDTKMMRVLSRASAIEFYRKQEYIRNRKENSRLMYKRIG